MEVYDQLNTFLVEIWGRINKIEERALAAGLGNEISVTEIHILEKIGESPGSPSRNRSASRWPRLPSPATSWKPKG